MDDFKTFTEIVHNIIVTGAAIIGGIWVVNRLKLERTDEAALEMSLSHTATKINGAIPDKYLVVFTIQLANKGKTKIEAKTMRTKPSATTQGKLIFEDGPEKLANACSLQIKQVDEAKVVNVPRLDWFESGPWEQTSNAQPEHSVLIDYQNPNRPDEIGNETAEFWMEPGETYRFGVPVILTKGLYVTKLTFVGADQERDWVNRLFDIAGDPEQGPPGADQNFWSQIYALTVPDPGTPDALLKSH
jgi:hypothetical protein